MNNINDVKSIIDKRTIDYRGHYFKTLQTICYKIIDIKNDINDNINVKENNRFLTFLNYLCDELKKFDNLVYKSFNDYDERGVRAFVRYSEATGQWNYECYRKNTSEESIGDHDWKMIRVGNLSSVESREIAEIKVLELAESICTEFNF